MTVTKIGKRIGMRKNIREILAHPKKVRAKSIRLLVLFPKALVKLQAQFGMMSQNVTSWNVNDVTFVIALY